MFEVDIPAARVVFTTRKGGHSEGPFASLNLGHNTGDDPTKVKANLERVQYDLEIRSLRGLNQVHGSQLVDLSNGSTEERPIADGATTLDRGVAMVITGADCPSVFIASERRLTGLHCGWRPVADGIIEKAAAAFEDEEFHAVIGPGICFDHFEVGDEVVEAMGQDGEKFSDRGRLDLAGVIEARLRRAGAVGIATVGRCTYCEPELFFSHRRDDGKTGRQGGIAWRI